MRFIKKFKALLIVIVIGLISLPAVVKDLKVFAQKDKDEIPPHVMCYKARVVTPAEKKLRELQNELNQLENLYSEGKINTETYTTRKDKLNDDIEKVQEEN